MIRLEEDVRKLLAGAMEKLGLPPTPIALEAPAQKEHGDLATNVAFLLAKAAKKSPFHVATELAQNINLPDWVEKVEVAKAGFINFSIRPEVYFENLLQIFKEGEKFGDSKEGKGRSVILEFVSANPTGPLNVVSARAAAYGDALANILRRVGFKVDKEYYVNNVGNQIDLFALSLMARYQEALGNSVPFPENGYHGDYIKELAADFAQKNKKYTLEDLKKLGLKKMVEEQKKSLHAFGVDFDRWFFQSELLEKGAVEKSLKKLGKNKHLYTQEGALFFKSTTFQDDKDRVVKKQDGDYSYFASDIAYHDDKLSRKYDLVIDVFGPDHHGYIARTKAAVEALGFDPKQLVALIVQQVNFIENETVVKMSKRAGKIVTMDALLAEVGNDVARYFFLQRSHQSPLDFDLALAKKETPENPVFYIQYAHARIASIFRKAAEQQIKPNFKKINFSLLGLREEKALAQTLLAFPSLVSRAAKELEPHLVAFYLLDLAKQFQGYYSQAKNDPGYRVLNPENRAATEAKLYLLKNIQIVLQNGLKILGVLAPEAMERDAASSL